MRFNGGALLDAQLSEDIAILNMLAEDQCKEILSILVRFLVNPAVS